MKLSSATWVVLLATVLPAQFSYPAWGLPFPCQPQGSNPQFSNTLLVDLDLDGDVDIVGMNAGSLSVRKVVGGAISSSVCMVPPGLTITRVTAGDLDLDGDPEIVAVTSGTVPYQVLTFENDGAGSFPYAPRVSLTSTPATGLAIGYFNADPFPDLLIMRSSFGPSEIFAGIGGGNFGTLFPGPTMATDKGIVLDDDYDGDDDVHELWSGTTTFSTYRNNAGTFSTLTRFTLSQGGSWALPSFGDFDLDGNLDVALVGGLWVTPPVGIRVALGNSSGSLTLGPSQPLPLPSVTSAAMADLDGDGDFDLVAASNLTVTGNQAIVYASNAGGTFTGATMIHRDVAAVTDVNIGDVTGDGLPDVVVGAIAVLPGLPSGGIAHATEVNVTFSGLALEVADLDADGRPDLISDWRVPPNGPATSAGISVTLNVESAPAAVSQTINTGTAVVVDIETGDWNRDGVLDVLLLTSSDLRMCLGTGGGALAAPVTIPGGGSEKMVTADVNADGTPDVIMAMLGSVITRLGDGFGSLGPPISAPTCPTPISAQCTYGLKIAAADLNGDGYADLVAVNPMLPPTYGDLSIFLGNGAGVFTRISSRFCLNTTSIALDDMNGDHVTDIVLCTQYPAIERLLGLGGGNFATAAYFLTKSGWGRIVTGDVNGDGFPDAVMGDGEVFLNDGAGGLVPHETIVGISNSVTPDVAFADLNRDLQPDLLFFGQYGFVPLLHNLHPCSGVGYAYGLGCPGAAGFVPKLSASGCPNAGSTLTLNVARAVGASPFAQFVVAPGPASVPIGSGCTVLIQLAGSFLSPFPVFGPAAPGQGWSTLSLVIPPSLSGTSVALQAMIWDPASPFSWSGTNALGLTFQ